MDKDMRLHFERLANNHGRHELMHVYTEVNIFLPEQGCEDHRVH